MGCTVSEQPGTWGATRASAPRGVSAGASPAGLLRCLGRSVLTDAQCARKTTWEKMPRATKPRKRRMVPRKSVPAATKCPSRVTSQSVSTNRLTCAVFQYFFLPMPPTRQSIFTLYLNLSQSTLVQRGSLSEIQFAFTTLPERVQGKRPRPPISAVHFTAQA